MTSPDRATSTIFRSEAIRGFAATEDRRPRRHDHALYHVRIYGPDMGLFSTRWEGTYQGHSIVVARSELTRGFNIEWDGTEIARRRWSFIGLGELHGTATLGDREVPVHVAIEWGGLNGKCVVTVDGREANVVLVK
jgi:hypothetical protein